MEVVLHSVQHLVPNEGDNEEEGEDNADCPGRDNKRTVSSHDCLISKLECAQLLDVYSMRCRGKRLAFAARLHVDGVAMV